MRRNTRSCLGERQELSYRRLKPDAQATDPLPSVLRLRVRLRWVSYFLPHALLLLGMPCWASPCRAADDTGLRSLIDKALQAHGGQEQLTKFNASTAKLKGTLPIEGTTIAFTGEIAGQGADQQRIDISLNIDGQSFRIVQVLNRDRGWVKFNDSTVEMEGDKLKDTQEEVRADWLATLLPLADKAVALSPLGEMVIEGRAAVGLNASRPGHRDVSLVFDKETSRLVKIQSQARNDATGQLVTEETFLSGYKEVANTQQAMKFVIKRDGKPHAEFELTELKLEEKLDASVFAAP